MLIRRGRHVLLLKLRARRDRAGHRRCLAPIKKGDVEIFTVRRFVAGARIVVGAAHEERNVVVQISKVCSDRSQLEIKLIVQERIRNRRVHLYWWSWGCSGLQIRWQRSCGVGCLALLEAVTIRLEVVDLAAVDTKLEGLSGRGASGGTGCDLIVSGPGVRKPAAAAQIALALTVVSAQLALAVRCPCLRKKYWLARRPLRDACHTGGAVAQLTFSKRARVSQL